jgi:hypothetical protein
MFCLPCLVADGAEIGCVVETENKTLDGEKYRYSVYDNNIGVETLCKTLTDVYCAIEEANEQRKQRNRAAAYAARKAAN